MIQLVSYSCYMGQKMSLYNRWYNWSVTAVIWDRKWPYTTDDTTGKLQLLYGTENVPIQQMIQLVSYSCYMGQIMSLYNR